MSRQAVMFGAGNIGRGFIGQLFSESGCEVVFVDVDEELIATLNREGSYHLQTVFNDEVDDFRIGPVRAVNGADAEAAADVVAQADVGATAVGAGALKYVAPTLARGIARRSRDNAPPLNIIVCENLKGAAAHLRTLVRESIAPEAVAYLADSVGFVDTVIGRMVPMPTPEMRARDVSFIRVEPYKELPVDQAGFVGEIPEISAMEAHDNFPLYTARKLYIHNCGHALLAYIGYLRGHEFGYEAMKDSVVREGLDKGLRESLGGIVAEYGADRAWLEEHVDDLMRRFSNTVLADTIFRLGRDPLRKLAPSDRLVGAAVLA
ncbi:MAG: mannitol dehydrogenase, partial [Lentisphaeria bacterium]|nr:mannitol dehydrogenase [Lentisphaeria bacterium]